MIKRREEAHGKIGYAIEDLYNENLDHYYGILTQHFIESNNFEKGATYSKLAGRRAEKTGSINDAISYALKRIECIEKMPKTKSIEEKIVHLRTILGLYMTDMNFFKEAQEITMPIAELALKSADEKRVSQIETVLGILKFATEENFPKAFGYLEDALRRSKKTKDMPAIASASFWLGNARHFNCEFDKAEINIKTAENIIKGANISWREATVKSCLGYFVYYNQGKVDLAYEATRRGVKIAEKSGDIFSKTFAYSCHGISCFGKGLLEDSLEHLYTGLELSRKLDHQWWQPWTNHFIAEVYFKKENITGPKSTIIQQYPYSK